MVPHGNGFPLTAGVSQFRHQSSDGTCARMTIVNEGNTTECENW